MPGGGPDTSDLCAPDPADGAVAGRIGVGLPGTPLGGTPPADRSSLLGWGGDRTDRDIGVIP